MPGHLRFVALGDSTTYGIGDPIPGGWRGWARLLADAIGQQHVVAFLNVAAVGATATDARRDQLDDALGHRPDLASLIVGLNDTMRSTWDPEQLRDDLFTCADALHAAGALLVTARFHDHGAVFGLPGPLRRPLWRRIELVNAVYDELYLSYGGIRLDLHGRPEIVARDTWSVDRLHPSELGHRRLAHAFAELLNREGLEFPPPSLQRSGGRAASLGSDTSWMVMHGVPWMARRAWDLGPWAVRAAAAELRSARRFKGQPGIPASG